MVDAHTQSNPVEVLAVEFVESLRRGQNATVEDYAQRHPELADDIRDLFPTIARLERVRVHNDAAPGDERATLGPAQLTRLGDLRIVREIGRGGMGIVYEAEQESLRRRVAVKVLPRQALLDEKQLRRFEREARTAANLHHTNIVPILGVGESDGFRYYVMQYIRGVSLDHILPQIGRPAAGNNGNGVPADLPGSSTDASSLALALVRGEFAAELESDDSLNGTEPALDNAGVADNGDPHAQPSALAPTLEFGKLDTGPAADTQDLPEPALPIVTARDFGPQYWQSVARIGLEVASALDYAHQQGTLHRDIKPANLIIDPHGTAWVADFGLAKAMEHDDVSRTGDIVGTLKYMAPEQVSGEADARSDLFSLGLTLYEMLTLRPAFDESERRKLLVGQTATLHPSPPRSINPSIPHDLETIVLKSISPEREHRYQSAQELADDLQRFVDDRPIEARRTLPWERLRRWSRRNPALAATSATAMALLFAVAIASTVGYVKATEQRQRAEANFELAYKQRVRAEANADLATKQRERAEASAALTLSALDRIFERFAPSGLPVAFEDDAAAQGTRAPAVLSNEAADLLEELLNFYKELRDQEGDDQAYQERIALANRRLGDIDRRLGRYEQAETAYDRALALYGPLAEAATTPEHHLALAAVHSGLGDIHVNRRDFDDARHSYAEAERLLEPLVKQRTAELAPFELARVYYHQIRGNSLAPVKHHKNPSQRLIDDRDLAEQKLQRAIDLLVELESNRPDNPAYAHMLGSLYLEASSFHRRNDPTVSADYRDEAIAILEELDELHPEDPEYGVALCAALSDGNPRDRSLKYEDFDAFAERLNRARLRAGELVESHPQVPKYRELQAGLHHKLGTVLKELEFNAEAEQRYQETMDMYRTLSTRYPEAEEFYELKRAFAVQSLAGLLLKLGDRESAKRARDELQAGIRTMENAAASPSDQATIRARLFRCRQLLAEADRRLARPASPSEAAETPQ